MAKNNRHSMKNRRRREGKTDYKRRLRLLRSRQPRLVVRKTNNHTIVQIINYTPDGDLVVASGCTSQLAALGWKHSTSSIPASYLAGYLAGRKALAGGVAGAVVDIGLHEPFHGGRLFAAVKGAVDAGLSVPVSDKALPVADRLDGKHIGEGLSEAVTMIKQKVGA